jgi:hypothetical protein
MKTIFTSCLFLLSIASFAQDRSFGYTYTSNVLPKGAIDLEFWHTSRLGHKDAFYNAQDQRLELEFGLGKNVQTAFYFNRFQQRVSTGTAGTEVSNEVGFSNEWKFKLSDPVANKIGSALYAELGLKGGDELELETKLILDKIMGKHLVAFNATAEFEKEFAWEDSKVTAEGLETPITLNLAYMYQFKPSFGLGLEVENRNDVAKGEGWENSIFYAGPSFRFSTGKWFAIFNYMPQLGNVKNVKEVGRMVLDSHERHEIRVLLGISL